MHSFLRSIVLVAATAAIAGCAVAPRVFVDYDEAQSFGDYRLFGWISDDPMIVSGDRGPNPLVALRLQQAIKSVLEEKGFRFTENTSEADFVVAYTVGARDKMEIRQREVVDYYGEHWRWGYEYYGIANPRNFQRTEVTSREYAEGSLAIDIFDQARRSPVWHGSGSKRLTRAELEGKSADSTLGAVQTILAGFPPQ